jgi:class 3 adenylate cyclase
MEAPPLERRLAAILAADVEGYSRLMHGDKEATMATLSARRAVVDELIAQHRGRIANTAGDSVLADRPEELQACLEQNPNGHFAGLPRTHRSSPTPGHSSRNAELLR